MLQRLIVAVLFISSALLAAHLITTLLFRTTERNSVDMVEPIVAGPVAADMDHQQLADEILASQVFDSPPVVSSGFQGEDSAARASTGTGRRNPDELPIDAASKIRLIGTAAGTRPLGHAVVEDVNTRKQSLYHLYDLVPNVGEIVDIREERILIRRGRKEEWLELQNITRPSSRSEESGMPAGESQAPGVN